MSEPSDTAPGALESATQPRGEYKVLARKYRPKNFDELIGQDVMARILTNAFEMGRVHQAYMLTGVRGVGKTTTARILARALNYQLPPSASGPGVDRPTVNMPELGVHCQAIIESRHVDVIEMDAASHTGVDDVREIIEGVRYKPAVARMKVYIIDEVHMLSKQAFNALLKTLEEPPEHVKFIFATTEIEKVPITVRSRCLRFDLRRVEAQVLCDHLAKICVKEGVGISQEALNMIARAAEGSVRDSLSLLDQAIAQGGRERQLTVEDARLMLGLSDKSRIIALFEAGMAGQAAQALTLLKDLYDDGGDPAQILLEVAEFAHLATRAKIIPDAPLTATSPDEAEAARRNAASLSIASLNRAWQILSKGIAETRESARPLAAADMVLARLAYAADLPSPEEALRRLGFGAPPTKAPAPSPSNAPSSGSLSGSSSGFTGSGAAYAPAVQARANPAPQSAAAPRLKNFADIIAKASEHRDIQLKTTLERDVRLVKFEPGHIEFSLVPGASSQTPQILMRRLQEWTGERWMVVLSRQEGAPSIFEAAAAKARQREQGIAADPFVRAALEAFPGADIIDVRAPYVETFGAAKGEDAEIIFDNDFDSDEDF